MATSSVGWKWLTAIAAVVTIACGAFAVVAAVTSDDDGAERATAGEECDAASAQQVRIADFAFQPPTLSIPAGTCVAWTNEDSTTHTVRDSSGGVIASPNLAQGATYTVTFNDPGTYDYICTIHTSMTGSVTVTE
jgi:amicyanin